MTASEVNGIQLVVADCSVILENQIVETDTIVELEFVGNVPVVLYIESNLVEDNL